MADFDDMKSMGKDYLEHYGVLGMKWGVHKANKYNRQFNRDLEGVSIRKIKSLVKSGKITKDQYKKELKNIQNKKKNANKKLPSSKDYSIEKFKEKYAKPLDYIKEQVDKAEKERPGYNAYKKYRHDNRTRNARNIALGIMMAEAAGVGFARVRKTKQPEAIMPDIYKDVEQHYDDKYKITHDDFLAHHGVEGMKWGERNGPPYPLEGEGKKNFLQQVKESRKKKRRKKILKDPAKMVKYQDEFTIEELAEAIKKFDMVEEVRKRIPKVEKEQKQKLTLLQKQLASNPAKLAKNADKFNKNDYQLAYDRLKRQRDLQDMTIEDAKRPAKILGIGNAYISEIASGVGKVKGLTGDVIGTHDNIMLLTGSGKKYSDQYNDRYPGNKPQGITKKELEEYLRDQGLIQ